MYDFERKVVLYFFFLFLDNMLYERVVQIWLMPRFDTDAEHQQLRASFTMSGLKCTTVKQ